jgi:hypothetical protein
MIINKHYRINRPLVSVDYLITIFCYFLIKEGKLEIKFSDLEENLFTEISCSNINSFILALLQHYMDNADYNVCALKSTYDPETKTFSVSQPFVLKPKIKLPIVVHEKEFQQLLMAPHIVSDPTVQKVLQSPAERRVITYN